MVVARSLRIAVCLFLLAGTPVVSAADDDWIERDAARVLGAALTSERAYENLTYLCDRIGHRLSGSPGLEQAIAWSRERRTVCMRAIS